MKKKMVWRYNCDFCGRKGYSAGHMARHESICTMNPNRSCGMCRHSEYKQQPIEKLVSVLDSFVEPKYEFNFSLGRQQNNNEYIFKLFDGITDCPACILSAIRQSKREFFDVDEEGYHSFSFGFDFEEAKSVFWGKNNRGEF